MKLLESTTEEIQTFLENLAADRGAMKKEAADICWYMRGGITWDQVWQLTEHDKKAIRQTIKENIERTEKTGIALL